MKFRCTKNCCSSSSPWLQTTKVSSTYRNRHFGFFRAVARAFTEV